MSIVTLSATNPTARKPHTCSYLSHTIHPGEQYERSCNIYDGYKYTWKTCTYCKAIAAWMTREWNYDYAEEGISMESMQETMHTEWNNAEQATGPHPIPW